MNSVMVEQMKSPDLFKSTVELCKLIRTTECCNLLLSKTMMV